MSFVGHHITSDQFVPCCLSPIFLLKFCLLKALRGLLSNLTGVHSSTQKAHTWLTFRESIWALGFCWDFLENTLQLLTRAFIFLTLRIPGVFAQIFLRPKQDVVTPLTSSLHHNFPEGFWIWPLPRSFFWTFTSFAIQERLGIFKVAGSVSCLLKRNPSFSEVQISITWHISVSFSSI